MFHFKSCFNPLSFNPVHLMMGASFVLLSHSIAPSVWANDFSASEIRLAQAQLTTNQLPMSALPNASKVQYGDRVRGRLGMGSIRHQGRLFSIYHFEGEEGQLIRISLAGELASARPTEQIQTGSLLLNPALILLDPNGDVVAQQPEQTNTANAVIRMNLPMTGTYNILVTSNTIGSGGRYTLRLKKIEQTR